MGMSHHGDDEYNFMRRFIEQATGVGQRTFSAGRMGADDDGDLAYAIATDDRTRTIIIRFPKPVEWIGLGVKEAEELRDNLSERINALKCGKV